MNWSDYEAVWKRQPLPTGVNADIVEIKSTFETKRRKLHATLLVRDYSEAGAGLVVATVFGWQWWVLGAAGWPISIALLLVLFVSGVFVRERWRVRRCRLGGGASLVEKVSADLSELRHQRHLLLNVGVWYLAPLGIAVVIVLGSISHSRPAWDPVRSPLFLGGYGLFCLSLFFFVWIMNRRAVRKQLEPRIAELEKLLRELQSSV